MIHPWQLKLVLFWVNTLCTCLNFVHYCAVLHCCIIHFCIVNTISLVRKHCVCCSDMIKWNSIRYTCLSSAFIFFTCSNQTYCTVLTLQLLRESIAEHKPHIDKLLKIGPQLAELSAHEGTTVRHRFSEAERRYLAIKDDVKNRATALDEAFSQSAQVHALMFACVFHSVLFVHS